LISLLTAFTHLLNHYFFLVTFAFIARIGFLHLTQFGDNLSEFGGLSCLRGFAFKNLQGSFTLTIPYRIRNRSFQSQEEKQNLFLEQIAGNHQRGVAFRVLHIEGHI